MKAVELKLLAVRPEQLTLVSVEAQRLENTASQAPLLEIEPSTALN